MKEDTSETIENSSELVRSSSESPKKLALFRLSRSGSPSSPHSRTPRYKSSPRLGASTSPSLSRKGSFSSSSVPLGSSLRFRFKGRRSQSQKALSPTQECLIETLFQHIIDMRRSISAELKSTLAQNDLMDEQSMFDVFNAFNIIVTISIEKRRNADDSLKLLLDSHMFQEQLLQIVYKYCEALAQDEEFSDIGSFTPFLTRALKGVESRRAMTLCYLAIRLELLACKSVETLFRGDTLTNSICVAIVISHSMDTISIIISNMVEVCRSQENWPMDYEISNIRPDNQDDYLARYLRLFATLMQVFSKLYQDRTLADILHMRCFLTRVSGLMEEQQAQNCALGFLWLRVAGPEFVRQVIIDNHEVSDRSVFKIISDIFNKSITNVPFVSTKGASMLNDLMKQLIRPRLGELQRPLLCKPPPSVMLYSVRSGWKTWQQHNLEAKGENVQFSGY